MGVSANVSLALSIQEFTDGDFPSVRTFPADYERLIEDGIKVFAASGVLPASPPPTDPMPPFPSFVVLNPAEKLAAVTIFFAQHMGSTGTLTISGSPANGIPPLRPGQICLLTNEDPGWNPASLILGGPAGVPYKVIMLGV